MSNQENISHAATIFAVANMQESLDFYAKKLDFNINFTWGEPITYAVLKRGGVSIHLTTKEDHHAPSKVHCALYVFVYDVEKIYQQCLDHQIPIKTPPQVHDYGMKDFDITDPDGYIISFGCMQE